MPAVEAAHYKQEVEKLKKNPHIVAMAAGLKNVPPEQLAHGPGEPKFEFMLAANAEFKKRSGKAGGSIGAVGRALLALLENEPPADPNENEQSVEPEELSEARALGEEP